VETTPPLAAAEPLRRFRLSDGVSRTLFEEYARHRRGDSGEEETGWVLLGLRERDEAVALATLPAGTHSDAGVAHVRFNSMGQGVGSRIVRQYDRRLTILGVVHTHPGSLRHPSGGDYEGDSGWVRHLRGGEGVFGIGTADVRKTANGTLFADNPRENVQVLGELCFSWYSLRAGQRQYQPLTPELTLGPDLAQPLHGIWTVLEEHAAALDRLYCQQAGLNCQVIEEEGRPVLAVNVPLAEKGDSVRVLLGEEEPRYLVSRGGRVFQVDPEAKGLDRGVYLLLAELAVR
jgi:proteasome lid subunit RPN8/RPN11